MALQPLPSEFLVYEENFIFFFISVPELSLDLLLGALPGAALPLPVPPLLLLLSLLVLLLVPPG
jgi:hypothetical protein